MPQNKHQIFNLKKIHKVVYLLKIYYMKYLKIHLENKYIKLELLKVNKLWNKMIKKWNIDYIIKEIQDIEEK